MWQPVTYSVEPCRAEVLSPKMFSNGLFKNSYNVLDLPEAGRGSRVRSGRLKMLVYRNEVRTECHHSFQQGPSLYDFCVS